mmetsp:Transcript_1424/g.3210  ORF Transcript_1424/g.3210 Transcript_1424/m.3210 type:complete len:115 (-) Transcript_1424:374-718(-)
MSTDSFLTTPCELRNAIFFLVEAPSVAVHAGGKLPQLRVLAIPLPMVEASLTILFRRNTSIVLLMHVLRSNAEELRPRLATVLGTGGEADVLVAETFSFSGVPSSSPLGRLTKT